MVAKCTKLAGSMAAKCTSMSYLIPPGGVGKPLSVTVPVCRVLVYLSKLPVHRIDVHIVVFLKVPYQHFNGVVISMEQSLTLIDLLNLGGAWQDFIMIMIMIIVIAGLHCMCCGADLCPTLIFYD